MGRARPPHLAQQERQPRAHRREKAAPSRFAMCFNCQTDLIETFVTLFPNDFSFEGRRAIVFDAADAVPRDALAFCIAAALTCHRSARTRSR